MPIFETIAIALVLLLGWYWLDSLNARDIAVAAAKAECAASGQQFLDENVVMKQLRLTRNDDGQLQIGRHYFFEYSDSGTDRRRGSVVMIGKNIIAVHAGLYQVH